MIPFIDFPNSITCIDRNGDRNEFKYNLEEEKDQYGRQKWVFLIIPEANDVDEWFEFSIVRINGTTGKVSGMHHSNEKKYVAKGIPDKMIEEAAAKLGLEIISSTNDPKFKVLYTEWRSVPAGKVWQRLVNFGKAEYDSRTDTFRYIA